MNHSYSTYARGKCRCDECREAHRLYRLYQAEHGTRSTYNHHRCRCQPCTRAALAYFDVLRERGLPEGHPHGISAYNNYGCRCDVCREACRERGRRHRERRKAGESHAPRGEGR